MVIKNFLFHRVSDENDALWPPMKPVLFEKIIKKLTTKFEVVSLEEVLSSTPREKKNGKAQATILFDDGYKDNIDYAAPILKKYNCPATFYIVTDCIDKNIPTWTYILDNALQNTGKPVIDLTFEFVPEIFKRVATGKDLNMTTKKLKPWMKTLSNKKRLLLLDAITEQGQVMTRPQLMMNWGEVKQLAASGFIIGSHTDTHPMLAQLEDNQEIETELRTSYSKIQHHLGEPPVTISYPIGSYDQRVTALSKQVGYKYGLAVEQRFYNTKKDDLFAIPRVELYQEPWYKVNARISGFYSTLRHIWK